MQVRIAAQPEVVSKGKYNQIILKYDQDGKEKTDFVVSFGDSKPAYEALVKAKVGEAWELKKQKNGQYWNIVDASLVGAGDSQTTGANRSVGGAKNNSTGTWATAEERAQVQVYIIRQSSLAQAVASLGSGLEESVYIKRAAFFEKFIHEGLTDFEASSKDDDII